MFPPNYILLVDNSAIYLRPVLVIATYLVRVGHFNVADAAIHLVERLMKAMSLD